MTNSEPLRFVLKQEIINRNMSISQFANESTLPRSIFSLMFKKDEPKPIPFEHLIQITLTLGYPEDHFFEAYINEYFNTENFNSNRIKKVLTRCGELGLDRHLIKVTEHLGQNPYYVPIVFDIAEELNECGQRSEALLLYNWIITIKTDVSKTLLSTCHYRIFRSAMSLDSDLNLQILYRFLPYKNFLPIHLNLDASINALHILYNQKRFEEVSIMADELIPICIQLFGTASDPNFRSIEQYTEFLERHPVVYYGQAYLAKQSGLEGLKKYKEAQHYCEKYGTLQWFDDGSEIAKKEIDKFIIFAQANFWNFELLQGNLSVMPEYIIFLENHPEELIPGLITILEAANTFSFQIDYFLERFEYRFDELLNNPNGYYTEIAKRNNLSYLLYHLAIYHANAGRIQESFNAAVKCWNMSQAINNQQHFRLLASLTAFYTMCSESKS